MGVLRIAATAAAAPLSGISISNSTLRLSISIRGIRSRSTKRKRSTTIAMLGTFYVYKIGCYALAGYTFVRVARNWGKNALVEPYKFRARLLIVA